MKNLIDLFAKAYGWLIKGASFLQDPLLLIMRLYWGWSFFATGRGKLQHIDGVAEFFGTLHIPFPLFNAYLAGATECVGGLLLLAGLASRLICVPLTFILFIAYITAEKPALAALFMGQGLGEDEGRADQFLKATPFMFLVTVLIVLAFGPGRLSLDWIIGKIYRKKAAAPQP